MSEKKEHDNPFRDLRTEFDRLEVDDQARFLVEAALSLMANGAKEAGNVVSSVVDELADALRREWHEDAAESESADTSAGERSGPAAAGSTKAASGKTGSGKTRSGKGKSPGTGKKTTGSTGKGKSAGGDAKASS